MRHFQRHVRVIFAILLALGPVYCGSAAETETAERLTCAVVPFQNTSGRPRSAYLADVIAQSLQFQLHKLGEWQLVERMRLAEVLKEEDLSAAAITDSPAVRLLGAKLLVVGEYLDAEGLVKVSARLVETGTGKVVEQAAWNGHVSGLADDMAVHVAGDLSGHPVPADALPEAMQDQFARACSLLADDQVDEAIRACERVLDRHPRHVPTLLVRGEAELRKKGWSQLAVKDFTRVLEQDADNLAAKLGLARALMDGDERSWNKSLRWLEEVLAEHPDHGEALYLAAIVREHRGRSADALEAAEAAAKHMPRFAPVWQIVARLKLAAQDHTAARQAALKATQYDPDDARSWMLLGDAQFALKQRPEAQESFHRALKCQPPPELRRQIETRLLSF